MNIMLSRILTYLNGTLFMDYRYQFCRFVVFNYEYLEDWDFEDVIEKSGLIKCSENSRALCRVWFGNEEVRFAGRQWRYYRA